jgi:hypothetical protein
MIKVVFFTYTNEQWNAIKGIVSNRLGLDADLIEWQITRTRGNSSITEMQPLRNRIEIAASVHIRRSALESQTPGDKARIRQLTTLRGRVETLRADIIDVLAPSFTIAGATFGTMPDDADVIGTAQRATAKVVSVIDASIAAQRPQQIANTRKAGRDRFWNEMLAIWISIGGAESNNAAAEFLVAVSDPVFDRVRAIGGHKTTASIPQDIKSVVEWLRLRAKARKATTS